MLGFPSHLNPFCLGFQPKDFVCGISLCHHSHWGLGALRKDSKAAVGAWFIPQNKIQVTASWRTHVASSVPRTLGGFLWHGGPERKGKWIFFLFSFFKCKLPSPITPNWKKRSFGAWGCVCHITSYLGMLQTFWIVGCDNPEWGIFIFPLFWRGNSQVYKVS